MENKNLVIIDNNKYYDEKYCMARRKNDIKLQCKYKKKIGDYCGFHKNGNVHRVDKPIKETFYIIKKKYFDNTNYNKILVKDIKNSLKYYNIKFHYSHKKKQLYQKLEINFKLEENINDIIKIQKFYKKYIIKKRILFHGPALYERNLCVNEEDFFTCMQIEDIPNNCFFSFRTEEGFVYGFDIYTFHKLVINNYPNPYNQKKFPKNIINKYKKLYNSKKHKINFVNKLTSKQMLEQRALYVFHKYDKLDHYTNINWFLNLSREKLKKFYTLAEDIWNYRAQLPFNIKKKIIPSGIAFHIPIGKLYEYSKSTLRNIILEEMDRFVSLGQTRDDKVMGAMYMLTALVAVSPEAAQAMPHLIQTV